MISDRFLMNTAVGPTPGTESLGRLLAGCLDFNFLGFSMVFMKLR